MELRSLEEGDEEAVLELARRSFETTYIDVLPADVIDRAVETWYSPEAIEAYRADDEMDFVLAEIDGALVGFGQSHVIEELGKGRVLWIHVDPDHRGIGLGSDILHEMVERLHDRGIETVTAVVLADHESGLAFYRATGFERLAERTVEIGGEEFRELILQEEGTRQAPLEMQVDADGDQLYVDLEQSDRGSIGPFCVVYRDPNRDRRYGWFCTVCESLDTAMDTMGRIHCSSCDNTRKPTRWDAAYL